MINDANLVNKLTETIKQLPDDIIVNAIKEIENEDNIEELDDEYASVEPNVSFDLSWNCKECGNENVEYNIPIGAEIICTCEKCKKQYEYYYEPY